MSSWLCQKSQTVTGLQQKSLAIKEDVWGRWGRLKASMGQLGRVG